MSTAENSDIVRRSLDELESQHADAHRLLGETLAELQQLFDEIETRAEQLAEASEVENPGAAELQAQLDQALRERDELAETIEQLRSQPPSSGDEDVADLLELVEDVEEIQRIVPDGAEALRLPFEQLRELRKPQRDTATH